MTPPNRKPWMQIAAPLNDLQFAGLLAAILADRPVPVNMTFDSEEEARAYEAKRLADAAKRASHLMLHVAFEAAVGSFDSAIHAGITQGKARLEQLELERRAALEQKPAEPTPLIITEEG